MSDFDKECPRCHGKGVPKPASLPSTPQGKAPVAPLPGFPPLASARATQVNNTVVWLLAFTPLIALLAQGMAGPDPTMMTFLMVLFVSEGICQWRDEAMLKRAGYDLTAMGAWKWFAPTYLLKRAQIVGESNAYAWFWLAGLGLCWPAVMNNVHRYPTHSTTVGTTSTTAFTVDELPVGDLGSEADGMFSYVTGVITNKSNRTANYVSVQFQLFDGQGNIVGTAWDNISNLQPGARWKFRAMMNSRTVTFKLSDIRAM